MHSAFGFGCLLSEVLLELHYDPENDSVGKKYNRHCHGIKSLDTKASQGQVLSAE